MTRRPVLLGLLAVLAAAQLAVPVVRIVRQEWVLRHGRAYKFRTEPVDPFDALRGRYVALDFEQDSVPEVPGVTYPEGREAYALLAEGPDGFAVITGITARRPEGEVWLRVYIAYVYDGRVHLVLPFERYYLEEGLAPEAEEAYREHSRQESRDAYATVRVWKGRAVLEELYVAGQPILEFLRHATEGP